jgi:hypothetical protein
MTPEDMAYSKDVAVRNDIPAQIVIDEKGITFKYPQGVEPPARRTVLHARVSKPPGSFKGRDGRAGA